MGADGGRYAEFVVNEQEKTRFTIYTSGKECEIPKNGGGISFTVRSVKDTYERLVKKGVESKMPPTKMPWGEMAMLTDPDGNMLTVNSAPQAEKK
ncbi:hypothetical protein BGZ49_005217 [Haplosporangium sp. Z 27]|nr:hypothetical protein BGZ49_005217 [Haplosporangium sp. Z 27]